MTSAVKAVESTGFLVPAEQQQRKFKKVKKLRKTYSQELAKYEKNMLLEIDKTVHTLDMRPRPSRRQPSELVALPTRLYFDECITPILYQGLKFLAVHRPAEPVNCLVAFLLKHKAAYDIPREKVELLKPQEEEESTIDEDQN